MSIEGKCILIGDCKATIEFHKNSPIMEIEIKTKLKDYFKINQTYTVEFTEIKNEN